MKGEAISLVATASSKLAAVEDVGPTRPETSSTTSVKVSPATRATLQSLRTPQRRIVSTKTFRNAETITEVCSGGELPEVEIISLLEEQIPRYRLRADTLTQFQGYENEDWFIPAASINSLDVDLQLSPDQIRETLNYFILCSNRVSQMTKTYNDIEAVTRLLEEKEKDLELTARIGKELLSHNQKLETSVQELETELKVANEKITQLSYDLSKKSELIQVLTNDVDESSPENEAPTGSLGVNLDVMQRKIYSLEDENKTLRCQFTKLVHENDNCEEQEARLVKDIAAQLANANMEVDGIADELDRQKEENRLQHEQIVSLTAKLAETELRLASLVADHDEIGTTLMITKENQNTLASELAEFKDRYTEVVNMLTETQEQLRKQRKRSMPVARGGALFPSLVAAPQPDSIASELESSLYSESSLDSGIMADRIPSYKKVFETVRSASRSAHSVGDFPRLGTMTMSTLSSQSSGPRMSSTLHGRRPRGTSFLSLDSAGQSDSESFLTDNEEYPAPQGTGIPGAPGAADLEAALRRLTPAEVMSRRACLSTGTGYKYEYDGGIHSPTHIVPFGCRTPDSIMSTGSSGHFSGFSTNGSNRAWRIPEKLQIIKPMEGSQTLHHWAQLATPTLSGLLEDRPGVKTRGGRGLEELGLETYTLADVEEDEEYCNPGKLFQDTGSVYTLTNSTVMHPDDHTSMSSSLVGSHMDSAPSSEMNSGMNTPRTRSRRNSTSTFSTTLGLAKMLNERGIKAVTPSCLGSPNSDKNFTPTATPCNSPDGTPNNSRSPSPSPTSTSMSFGLLATGADILKRTFGSETPTPTNTPTQSKRRHRSRSDKNMAGIKIVEKLERIGIESIIAATSSSTISPLALQGALCTRRSNDSPMAQLTFLKGSISSSRSQDDLDATSSDRSTISEPSFASNRDCFADDDTLSASSLRESSRRRLSGSRSTRSDVGPMQPDEPEVPTTEEEATATSTTLGTLSSLIFGRKGGLR